MPWFSLPDRRSRAVSMPSGCREDPWACSAPGSTQCELGHVGSQEEPWWDREQGAGTGASGRVAYLGKHP